jgi:hypothetical protein
VCCEGRGAAASSMVTSTVRRAAACMSGGNRDASNRQPLTPSHMHTFIAHSPPHLSRSMSLSRCQAHRMHAPTGYSPAHTTTTITTHTPPHLSRSMSRSSILYSSSGDSSDSNWRRGCW